MRIAAWLATLCGGRSLARDLQDEVDFHIAMRAAAYEKDGATADEAAALARKQFGNEEKIMNDMRRTHLASRAGLIAIMTASLLIVALWVYGGRSLGTPVEFPAPALPMRFVKRPPPPPPPTWEEFAAKVNTFGDGSARRRRR